MRAYQISDVVSSHPDDGKRKRAVILMKCFSIWCEEQWVVHLGIVFMAAIPVVSWFSQDMEDATICWMVFVAGDAVEVKNFLKNFLGALENFN